MGRRGPAKTPGSVRWDGGLPSSGELPPPPPELSGAGLDEWNRISVILKDRISSEDWALVLSYCIAVDDIAEASKIIEKEGRIAISGRNQTQYVHPAVGMRNKAAEIIARASSRLGLSPADRASFKVDRKQEDQHKAKFFGAKIVG